MGTEAVPKGLGRRMSLGAFWGTKLALLSEGTIYDVFGKFWQTGTLDNFDALPEEAFLKRSPQ